MKISALALLQLCEDLVACGLLKRVAHLCHHGSQSLYGKKDIKVKINEWSCSQYLEILNRLLLTCKQLSIMQPIHTYLTSFHHILSSASNTHVYILSPSLQHTKSRLCQLLTSLTFQGQVPPLLPPLQSRAIINRVVQPEGSCD